MRVVVVCTGNICRSPTAEAVLRHKLVQAGLAERVVVDSAGTYAGHGGEAPDTRAQEAARRRGYDLSDLRARGLASGDAGADLVLAMDRGHLRRLQRAFAGHPGIRLFLSFDAGGRDAEVPDPYYGTRDGFEQVLDLIEEGAAQWVAHIRTMLDGGAEATDGASTSREAPREGKAPPESKAPPGGSGT